jgi:hypothetical protein
MVPHQQMIHYCEKPVQKYEHDKSQSDLMQP